MFDTLADLSSAIDWEALIKGIKGLIDASSESNTDSEGLSSVFEGLSSKDDAEAAAEAK
ncbi:hypothetical protein RAE06_05590 [Corynebacterium tuberculostearicum]|uniref:hypothetical protein n=1 Tax=Corynebacterium tuberculostearicum TaxID=38304 RepID=UPI0029340EE1|nr:hypothetical protein [Corynebacterium tuberculostearicum]MDV2428366.1 hypothetical protein [Corynebacterium tuberculostearicum]